MTRVIASAFLALTIVFFGLSDSSFAAGGGKGGTGGGGSVKPLTVRLTGIVTAIEPAIGGVKVTLGTSYYATGTFLVTSNTKIKLNGSSGEFTAADIRLGDSAQADVNWLSRIADKMEVIGLR